MQRYRFPTRRAASGGRRLTYLGNKIQRREHSTLGEDGSRKEHPNPPKAPEAKHDH